MEQAGEAAWVRFLLMQNTVAAAAPPVLCMPCNSRQLHESSRLLHQHPAGVHGAAAACAAPPCLHSSSDSKNRGHDVQRWRNKPVSSQILVSACCSPEAGLRPWSQQPLCRATPHPASPAHAMKPSSCPPVEGGGGLRRAALECFIPGVGPRRPPGCCTTRKLCSSHDMLEKKKTTASRREVR